MKNCTVSTVCLGMLLSTVDGDVNKFSSEHRQPHILLVTGNK